MFLEYIFSSNIIFWLGWVSLPILIEFIPSLVNFILLIKKKRKLRENDNFELNHLLPISIIIPIYNSEKTLYNCIKSIVESNYDTSLIDVICVDNGSTDNSFQIYKKCQIDYPQLCMNYIFSHNGKSKAMNKAIYNCTGSYIINIDSDGFFEKNALMNIIKKFILNPEIDCMTGTILIDPISVEDVDKKDILFRTFKKLEFLEYGQAFLAGRNFQAELGTLFTMSGAFSAFKKSTLLKTRLYNTETVGEDTNLTFQIKNNLHKKVSFCENALFFVDSIESINKFYTQRQRWQLGELEVANQFMLGRMKNPFKLFSDYAVRTIILDHTMSFSKLIWLFVMIILAFINKSYKIVAVSLLFLYFFNLITSIMYSINVCIFLENFNDFKKYYIKNLPYLVLLPIYNIFGFIVRMCGIINSMKRKSSWKTNTLTEEKEALKKSLAETFSFFEKFQKNVKRLLEK